MTAPTLEDLTVAVSEIDRGLLAGVLAPYVRLDRDKGKVLPLSPGWDALTNDQAVMVYLLACRALGALGLRFDVRAAPKQIELDTGMPGGSVRSALRRLLRGRWVEQDKLNYPPRPVYTVPLSNLLRIQAKLPQSEV